MQLSRLVRQVTSSTIATTLDLVLLVALVHVANLPPTIAGTVGAIGGGCANFAIGRIWVFEARGSVVGQAVGYAVLVVGGGALINGAIVGGLAAAGVPLVIAKVLAVGLVMIAWTYPVCGRIFRRRFAAGAGLQCGPRPAVTLP
ncbi:MAG: GtrA family protein [Myxococcota bacterium]|nr:GtrA family protein [Myxococcota bacterium]